MLKIVFTLDYELHGNGEGDPSRLMVEPTRRFLDLFDQYDAKLTVMAETAEILKFRDYKEEFGRDDYRYEAVAEQLRYTVRRGHDVQLHLHPSYLDARFDGQRWVQDWRQYNLAGLGFERLKEIVGIGKEFLEALLRPVHGDYRCFVFRAANWCFNPSKALVRALVDNGISIDTSVYRYGRRNGVVNFDYSNAHSNLVPWPVDESNICLRHQAGKLLEVPIYSERRWIGTFLSWSRFSRAIQTRAHNVVDDAARAVGTSRKSLRSQSKRLLSLAALPFARHAWKADFNQCTGRQLIGALTRAERNWGNPEAEVPIVLIGHSKLCTPYNERTLRPFLAFVAEHPDRFSFSRFGDLRLQVVEPH
jgi:hypothetical protein